MEYKIQPWKHQLTAIERAKDLPWFALFFEMGAGQTMTVINILRAKMNQARKYLRTLVLCPPIVIPNWKDEFLMHTKLDPDMIVLLNEDGKHRIRDFKDNAYSEGSQPGKIVRDPRIFVTNYESLTMGSVREKVGKRTVFKPGPLLEEILRWAPEAVIFDESHRIKNYKAARSHFANVLANPKTGPKPLTYLLSGSPVLNSPMDLFHQFLVMDGGATFGTNFFMFRARYFEDKNAGMLKNRDTSQRYFPNWVVKEGSIEEINRLIFRYGMRVTKEECLDLPDEVPVTIKVRMTEQQVKNYREMKNDYLTFVDGNSASATLAIVKALRLMQITSGFLSLDARGEENDVAKVVYQKTPKVEALKELLEDITPHSKVIVWAVWKENYEIIKRTCLEVGVQFVEVHGNISRGKQDEAVARFKSDPDVRVFIGHPGSGGIGINLVCAPYSIFYSRTFSLEHFLQARARNHRGGQTQKVTHYDLVCEHTIDELVQKKLALKLDLSDKLLNAKLAQEIQEQEL